MVFRSSEASREDSRPHNAFRNDGSFLELFKKMQEDQAKGAAGASSSSTTDSGGEEDKKAPGKSESSRGVGAQRSTPLFGKRRGGRVLPTGKVKKIRPEGENQEDTPKDAWAVYLAEVKRYKETTCEEDGKTRPLVK